MIYRYVVYSMANVPILKNGKAKPIRLSTLEVIRKALECHLEIFQNTKVTKIFKFGYTHYGGK